MIGVTGPVNIFIWRYSLPDLVTARHFLLLFLSVSCLALHLARSGCVRVKQWLPTCHFCCSCLHCSLVLSHSTNRKTLVIIAVSFSTSGWLIFHYLSLVALAMVGWPLGLMDLSALLSGAGKSSLFGDAWNLISFSEPVMTSDQLRDVPGSLGSI